MSGSPNQKLKLLFLMKILLEQTDEENPLTINELIIELSKYEIAAERKALYNDLDLLKEFGLDIICKRNKSYGYYVGAREFELPELKLLVDAVQSSRFITKKKSTELIKKLEGLTSRALAKNLQDQVFIGDRVKPINERIYYNIDTLYKAIAQGNQVSFKYFEYTLDKKKIYRHNGKAYIVSPFALTWTEDKYYLISHYAKHMQELTHFRVDRMDEICIQDNKRTNIEAITGNRELNLAKYTNSMFGMYSGETERVKILFSNELVNVVIDRFGEEVSLIKADRDHFSVTVEVTASTPFLAWLFQFGNKAKILWPEHVQKKMREMISRVGEVYK